MKALEIRGELTRVDEINNDLRALQHAVDGYIETVWLSENAVMIVDEKGMLKGKPYNTLASLIAHTCIYGTALIVGTAGEEFTDCPPEIITGIMG